MNGDKSVGQILRSVDSQSGQLPVKAFISFEALKKQEDYKAKSKRFKILTL